jgi:hypothetical protein
MLKPPKVDVVAVILEKLTGAEGPSITTVVVAEAQPPSEMVIVYVPLLREVEYVLDIVPVVGVPVLGVIE